MKSAFKLPFGIKLISHGPYGMGWWGFKVETTTIAPTVPFAKRTMLTISLGKRWASDGYQMNWVNRAFGIAFFYGKHGPAPLESADHEGSENEMENECSGQSTI